MNVLASGENAKAVLLAPDAVEHGVRFVFALSQIAKMFEMCDLERRIGQLEQILLPF